MDENAKPQAREPSETLSDPVELRRQRIEEYGRTSLKLRDPLRANLGAEAATLMSMALRLQPAVENLLNSSNDVVSDLERVRPSLETYLKITRQWDRLVQVDQRICAGENNGKLSKIDSLHTPSEAEKL